MTEHLLVGVIMGSKSDWDTMTHADEMLTHFGVAHECKVVSAHRTPELLTEYARTAEDRGLQVIIAGAGGAAHLPGMVASLTSLPVIGVPVKSSNSIDGWDSILSILQMPSGIPVATVALNGGKNAGILAASIVGAYDPAVGQKMDAFKTGLREKVEESAAQIEEKGWKEMLKK
jgi:5-(carboxyamino)imidazole ribonucleotide mutase